MLQDVVEGLSETFIGVNDALVRSGYLSRDREIARVLREGMERFVMLSKMAQQEADDDLEETSEQDASEQALAGVLGSSTASVTERGSKSKGDSEHPTQTPRSAQPVVSLQSKKKKLNTGWFSPRLGYSVLWSDPPSPPSSPRATNNILHYVTAGHDSFAARLYWNSLTLAFRSLRGDEGFPIDLAKSMFRYKMRYSGPQQVLTVIGHVLNQMLLGTSDITFDESRMRDRFVGQRSLPDPSETGAVDTNAVKNAIHRDIIQDGGLVDEYLDTWAVERYIADQWAVLVNSSTARLVQRNLVMDIDPLLERLTAAAVTIGEGPRYPTRDIDMAVQSFLKETHSTGGIVA
jgi:hypothetical protein